jgi:hypothetical protein
MHLFGVGQRIGSACLIPIPSITAGLTHKKKLRKSPPTSEETSAGLATTQHRNNLPTWKNQLHLLKLYHRFRRVSICL